MLPLEPTRVRWIFVHTAAYSGDCGVAEIRDWHLRRGWDDIGYHFVVRRDGTVEEGREVGWAGAHVEGCNTKSIGICCEGHGDYEDHTPAQRDGLLRLCRTLMERYDINPRRVLGHREVNALVDAGEVGDHYRTPKTCPGGRVDMEAIRAALGAPAVPAELPQPVLGLVDSMGIAYPRLRRLGATPGP